MFYLTSNYMRYCTIVFCVILGVFGCVSYKNIKDDVESAMSPNSTIIFADKNREISIKWMSLVERCYILDGYTNTVTLVPRKIRYYGSRGLTYSGAWNGSNGINRAIVNEGQQHFCSEYEATFWLSHGWNNLSGIGLVYTKDGLAVGYVETLHRKQINIDVWQIYINGRKPESLNGARAEEIRVLHNNLSSPEPLNLNYEPSTPSEINGIIYSGRALDILKELVHVTVENVEDVLKHGKKSVFEDAYIYYDVSNIAGGIRVIVDSKGMVMSIYP